jgi:hypothetical protein
LPADKHARKGVPVPKYMVLYRSSVPASEQMGSDPEAAQAGMALWMNWAGRVGGAMADMGSPLGSVATITASGSTADISSPLIGGFSVLEADSVDAAKKLLDDHPHFHAPGDRSIEVLEFLPIPGM